MKKAKEEKWREAQAEPNDDMILRILRMRPEAANYLRDRSRQKERLAAAAAADAIVKQSLMATSGGRMSGTLGRRWNLAIRRKHVKSMTSFLYSLAPFLPFPSDLILLSFVFTRKRYCDEQRNPTALVARLFLWAFINLALYPAWMSAFLLWCRLFCFFFFFFSPISYISPNFTNVLSFIGIGICNTSSLPNLLLPFMIIFALIPCPVVGKLCFINYTQNIL